MMSAPSRANAMAVARPIPRATPVMISTFPARRLDEPVLMKSPLSPRYGATIIRGDIERH
jgi:hypothetical protein